MKQFFILGLAVLCLVLSSCSHTSQKQQTDLSFAVPELLQRNEAIQNGKEWEHVQNIYTEAQREIDKDTKAFGAYLKLAEVFINEARITGEHGHYYPGALASLNHLLSFKEEKNDTRFQALSLKASVLLSQHEFLEAKQIALEAISMNPYNAAIYGALVDACVELGEYEAAVKATDKMVSIRPDLRSYARVSYLRQIHGQVDGAIESMKMAVAAGFPGYEQTCWTRLTLGELYQQYGKNDLAEVQYQKALAEREQYPFALAALADIAISKKEYDKAEKLLNQARDIIPEVGFYSSLAALYQETNRPEKAQELIPIIDEMMQDDVIHGHNMNMEYASYHLNLTKNHDKALQYALEEYSKRPENIDVNKMLAFVYFEKEDFTNAFIHLEKAQSTGSKDPDLICINGLLALKTGKPNKAYTLIKEAFRINPNPSHSLAEIASRVLS